MVVVSILPHTEFVRDDHREYAPHFSIIRHNPAVNSPWWTFKPILRVLLPKVRSEFCIFTNTFSQSENSQSQKCSSHNICLILLFAIELKSAEWQRVADLPNDQMLEIESNSLGKDGNEKKIGHYRHLTYTVVLKSDTFWVQPNSQKCVTFRHEFRSNFQKISRKFQKCVTFRHVTFWHDSVFSSITFVSGNFVG